MASWLSQFAIACAALIIARYLIHIVLSLKYNFQYGHLGFLSISGIQYHIRAQLEHNPSVRSITFNIGKVKLRLRHRFFQSRDDTEPQRAFVSLHIQDVQIVLHDLALLRKQAQQQKELREQQKRRGGGLVSVGETLTRIPWWYSLSIVKWVIRMTSAIPAQLIISGLTQYVDVRFEELQVIAKNVATFRLEYATLSSILFADVQRNANDLSTPMDMRDQWTDASMLLQELLINAKHQQHSFKKANHLWKEKFFEVNATLGPMWIMPTSGNSSAAISLPARSHMALSCHLSAACTTLKSITLDVRIGNIDIDADQIMALYHVALNQASVKDAVLPEETHKDQNHTKRKSGLHRSGAIYAHNRTPSADPTHRNDKNRPSSLLLLKEFTLAISDIEVSKHISEKPSGQFTEKLALCIETTSIACVRDQLGDEIDLQLFPHSATFSTKRIELAILPFPKTGTVSSLFAVSGIEASVKATESLLLRKTQALTAQIVDTFATDHDHVNEDPNLQFIKGSIDVLSPRLTLDMDKMDSYQQTIRSLTPPSSKPSQKKQEVRPIQRQMQKVPRFLLAISIGSPKLYITNFHKQEAATQDMPEYTGFEIQDILVTFSGNYIQMSDEPATPPLASPLGSPTRTLDSFLQAPSPPQSPTVERPTASRWKTLLRKSWRSYSKSPTSMANRSWTFDVLASVQILGPSSAFPSDSNDKPPSLATLDNTLIHVSEINITVRTSLIASMFMHRKRQPPLMQFVVDNPLIDFCLSVDQPSINLWSAYGNTRQLTILQQAVSSTLEVFKTHPRSNVDTSDRSKSNGAFTLPPLVRNTNITFAIHNLCLGVVGSDEGIRSKRPVPDGYIDNAPLKDTHLGLALYIESLSICYKSNQANTDRTLAEAILEMPCNENMLGAVDCFVTGSGVSPCVGFSDGRVSCLTGLGGEKDCFIHLSQVDSRAVIRLKSDENGLTVISKVSISFGRILIYYTLQNHYATLLAVLALKSRAPKLSTEDTPQRTASNIKFATEKCSVVLHHIDLRSLLPGDLNLFLRMKELHFELPLQKPRIQVRTQSIKLFGIAPSDTSSWDQLIGIDELSVVHESSGDDTSKLEKNLVISSSGVHICVPYNYVVANIIDNAVNTFKSLKLLQGRLFSGKQFDWNGPIPKDKPVKMPNIRLRFEILTFAIEDDPFEGRLRLIYRTGTIQQKIRLANEEAFMAKAQSVESQQQQKQNDGSGRRAIDGEQVRNGFLNGSESSATSTSSARVNQNMPMYHKEPVSEKSNISVNVAWNRLQEHNANVWIRHIRAAQNEEEHGVQALCDRRRQHRYKGEHDFGQRTLEFTSKYLADLFDIRLVPPPKHPALLFSAMRHMDLTISIPTFPLGETRLFMQKIGNGIPLNTEFSTLAPFHLDWYADETWVQLRDYPLPLMYVPPSTKKDLNSWPQAWSLSGDYVFGDELGTKLATRLVNVTMLDVQNGANYYMSIPRTSSPPKFYSIVEIECLCSNPARMTWAQSMQPAIQDVARVFDYFTRPPVDPSEKLGFWDKIRHIIHTRTRIRFGGDFAICLKGTRDPYNLLGRGAGFVKIWSKEVQWLFGYDNPQNEFMQILSQEYMLAVPDLVNGTYVVKHILPAAGEQPKSRQRSETTSATVSAHTLPSKSKTIDSTSASVLSTSSPDFRSAWPSDTTGRNSSSAMPTKNCFERKHLQKIGLKLTGGVRWGVGCKYERKCDPDCPACGGEGKCRSLEFIPHYCIKYSTPANVAKRPDGGKNYDAYAGFRSNFIHFSISIVQDTNSSRPIDAVNALHLSPGFVDHFLQWFRLFGGGMGLPIRAGSLFPKEDSRASKKFGKHLSTVKYKIVTNSLSIGWFEKDEQSLYSINGTGHTVGMKASVSSFKVDLHQRRIITKIDSEEFGRERIKSHWLLHEAQIQLSDLDLRVVQATYSNIDPGDEFEYGRHAAVPSFVVDETSTLNSESTQTFGSNGSEFDESSSFSDNVSLDWVDLDDYVELYLRTPDFRPSVSVFPMMFSPNICYFKQTNREDVERYHYLHGTHECILGSAMDTRAIQVSLLHQRMQAIDEQIRKHQYRLDDVEQRLQQLPFEHELLTESQNIVEKTTVLFEKKSLLQRYLKSVLTQSMPDLPRTSSTAATSRHSLLENDPTDKWETLMGYFKQRCIVHNPQIIWNNSVRNLVYRLLDVHGQQRAHNYYMSMRAVKFLRDLTQDATSKLKLQSMSPMGGGDQELDMQMAQDLIDQLLADHEPNSDAPTVADDTYSTDNEPNVAHTDNNLNNPEYQHGGIPKGYEMKSSYIVELLNPQISLQSERNPDSIVLISTERTQLKGFNIVDSSGEDIDTAIVKNRTLFSVDNVQFFVAKKEHFDTVDLLFDNHYGALGSEHWLTWIPLEMLINYTKRSDKFQRVADRTAASMQYDTFNPLRLKSGQAAYNRIHPLEERCDSMTVSFPHLLLTANSAQFNAIVDVVVDLVLYSEPARKERLERLKEIMLTADMDNLANAMETVIFLQNSIRQLIETQEQYRLNLTDLREKQLQEYKLIKSSLQNYNEELYLVMEAIKKNPGGKQDSMQAAQTKLKVEFSVQKIIWEMIIGSDRTLCEWTLSNARYVWLNKEDHSSSNTVELDMLQCTNRLPNPTFGEIIAPYLENRKSVDFSRHKMLRGHLLDLPPVGGIPVVQHLEINLFPLKFQMTQEFGKLLASYVFPVEKRKAAQASAASTTIATSSSAPNIANSTVSTRSAPTDAPHTLLITSACDHPSVGRDSASLSTNSDFLSSESHLESFRSDTLRPKRSEDQLRNSTLSSNTASKRSGGKKHTKASSSTSVPNADDLSVMKERASNNRTFIYIKVPGAKHCLSYQGPKEKNIEDLYDFVFTQPTLEYRNRTWSWYELMNAVKKDILRAALKHSGALLRDKLKIRRHPRAPRTIASSPSFTNEPMYQKALAAATASENQKPSTSSSISIATQSSDGFDDLDEPSSVNDIDSIDAASDIIDLDGTQRRKKHQLFSSWSRGKRTDENTSSPSTSPSPTTAQPEEPRNLLHEHEIQRKGKLLFGKSYSGLFRTPSPSPHSRSTTNSD